MASGALVRRSGVEHQQLHSPACGLGAKKSGRDHFRLVDHQQVRGAEDVSQFGESKVLGLAGKAMNQEKARMVPTLRRLVGDEFSGQVIIVGGESARVGDFVLFPTFHVSVVRFHAGI